MHFYFLGNYDSRRGDHSYCRWTTGSDWCVRYDDDHEVILGYRSYDHDYIVEKVEVPPRETWAETSVEEVPGLVLRRVGVLKPKWEEAIAEELAQISSDSEGDEVEVLTSTQAWLDLEFGYSMTPVKVKLSREEYGVFGLTKWPTEYPKSALFSPDIYHRFFAYGSNAGHNYKGKVWIPWSHTQWSSKEAYLVYRREVEAAERKAEEEFKAEEAKRKEEEERRAAEARKEFARMCGKKAHMCGVPFQIALAFRGDEKELMAFVNSLKKAIDEKVAYNEHELLYCGRVRKGDEMRRLGLDIGRADPHRIADYVAQCFTEGMIITK